MNYFELFEIPVNFEIDGKMLKKKYYSLSKEFHPDRYTLQSEEKQIRSLEMSTKINRAFRTLSDRQKRIRYILELMGVEFHEGKEQVSQDFLMEMMDINESLMELQMDPDPQKKEDLLTRLEQIKHSLRNEIAPVMQNIDLRNPQSSSLQLIKDYYHKSRYITRLEENLYK